MKQLKMNKLTICTFVVILFSLGMQAQQDPHYTQYMYNMNVMNPAYAGSKDDLSIGLLYRQQWVNVDGAPRTGTLSIHSPVGKNVGLGLSAITDKIGPVQENNIFADFSYTLDLGGNQKLALGLKAGATFHKVGLFDDIGNGFVPQENDIAFQENSSATYLNFGTGVFYYTDKFYASASLPNIFKTKHLDVTQNGQQIQFGSETQHLFVTSGYVFDLSSSTKFKPSLMLKYAISAPVSFDFSGNFLFLDKFEIGATYRLDDSFGAMVNYAITPKIRVGYAYDQIVSGLKVTTQSSHEFLLLFDIPSAKKVSMSPRFF